MENKKRLTQIPILTVPLTIIVYAITSVWMGIFAHAQQQQPLIKNLTFFIAYLLYAELWQLINRNLYLKQKQLNQLIYALKTAIALMLIILIGLQSSLLVTALLVIYEIYQFFLFRNEFAYIDSILYPLMTGFFKGCVLNLILSIGMPFTFEITSFQPFYGPFIIYLLTASFWQGIYSTKENKGIYYLQMLLVLAILIGSYVFQGVNIVKIVSSIIFFVSLLFGIKKSKNASEKELYLAIFTLASIATFAF